MSIFLFLSITGCLPTMSASITGTIEDSSGSPISDPLIEIRAWDGTLLTEVTGESNGTFTVDLPPFQEFFVIASKEGYPKTSFTGYSGEGQYPVPSGTLWLRSENEVETALRDYEECFSTEYFSGFGVIEGLAKLYISGENTDNLPEITTATAHISINEESGIEGCYLPQISEDGETVSSTVTGDSGRYAIFGIEEGPHELVISVEVDGSSFDYPYLVYVTEGGITPMIPTLIPFLVQ